MFALLVLALAAQAASPPVQAQPARAPATAPKQKIRCVLLDETGSLAKRTRICKSVSDWDEQRRNADRQARDMQNPASQQGGPPG